MATNSNVMVIATRGSALAMAQAKWVLAQCQKLFPEFEFRTRVVKTTGDKLQAESSAEVNLPKGLFTKELETALLSGEADLAVHSLKDLPTELPPGLKLGAVTDRADVRDVLICKDATAASIRSLPKGATVATSSPRRSAQLLLLRPDLNVIPIKGNVPTRLRKLAEQSELDALVLAAAGLERLGYSIDGRARLLPGPDLLTAGREMEAKNLTAIILSLDEMLPCVGQGALGIEIREDGERASLLCSKLDNRVVHDCVAAERAFLRAMGGGCQAAVAAYAEPVANGMRLRAISFLHAEPRRGETTASLDDPEGVGQRLAAHLIG